MRVRPWSWMVLPAAIVVSGCDNGQSSGGAAQGEIDALQQQVEQLQGDLIGLTMMRDSLHVYLYGRRPNGVGIASRGGVPIQPGGEVTQGWTYRIWRAVCGLEGAVDSLAAAVDSLQAAVDSLHAGSFTVASFTVALPERLCLTGGGDGGRPPPPPNGW